ncbi:DUF5334 family protein [Aquipseudomonas alcaligenes]|uniref:DUF5334 family protein n=1 Tax=Aquipseudomonas alcaligenes TaxID=43263 RepID=UPI003748D584
MRGFFMGNRHPSESDAMRAALLFTLLLSGPALAWEGHDQQSKTNVDIDRGTMIKSGETIRFYDYAAGEYRNARIIAVSFRKGLMDIEVHDESSGQPRTLVMQR